MKINNKNRFLDEKYDNSKTIFWILLLVSMVLKYSYYGFRYFPIVDDHNMYGIFSMLSPGKVLSTYQMYTTRPLAALLDAFAISRLWDHLWIILAFITLLHFLTCYLLSCVFEKNNSKFNILAVVIFALLPLGASASYWIAASSRIVTGLFFSVLSFYLLMVYIEKRENRERHSTRYLVGFAAVNLISLGFYEQVIAFSFAGILLLLAVNFRRLYNRWALAIPFINLTIIALFYKFFSNVGNMASRGQLVSDNPVKHTRLVFKRITELMSVIPAKEIKHGAVNGFQLAFGDKAFLFLILAAAVGIVLGACYAREDISGSRKSNLCKLIIGIFLVILPFAPFFLLQVIWIVSRNTFVSLIGLGLVLEALIALILGKAELRALRGIAMGILVFVFMLANAAEVSDYRSIYNIDREIVSNVTETLDHTDYTWVKADTVIVLDTKPSYILPTSRELYNCTGNDWAFTGAVQSISRKRGLGYFLPVQDGQEASIAAEKLDKAYFLGMDAARNTFPLKKEWRSSKSMELTREDGSVFGNITVLSDSTFVFNKKNS